MSADQTGLVVAALVLAASVLLSGSPSRRLRGVRAGSRLAARDGPGWRARRARGRRRADPAQSVSELAALLRAGVPPPRAFDRLAHDAPLGPWGQVLTAARDASRTGEDVALAVSEAGEWCRDEEQRSAAIGLAAAWQVAQRTGAPAARVLDQLAVGLRSDEDARGAAAAAMAGPRATARLLAWLPAAGLLLGQLIGADPVAVLAGTRLGRLSAVLGGVLAVAGWLWTRRLLRAASAP